MGALRFALKCTVAGGVVYYTAREGLWSSSEDSVKLYRKIYSNVAPYVKENIPKEVVNELPKLPSTTDVTDYAKTNWNKGVMTSMKFLSELPSHTVNGVKSLTSTAKKYMEDQTTTKNSE